MAKDYYKLADLIKAISVYEPTQRQAALIDTLHARVRIGGSGAYLEQRLKQKSPLVADYSIKALRSAMAQERDPYRRLLFHNVMMRINFSYGAFLKASNALREADLSLVERHASWYTLYVNRFTRRQSLTAVQWTKSGYLLRRIYNQIVKEAQFTYRSLVDAVHERDLTPASQPHIVLSMSEFLDETHPLTKQAVDLGDALVRHMGARVSILNTSIPPQLPISYFGDHALAHVVDAFKNISTLDHGSHRFSFSQNPNKIANSASFTWYARQLEALNPTAVITIGPGNVIADTFAATRPTLAFPNIGEVPLSAAPIQCSVADITPLDRRLLTRAGTCAAGAHTIKTAFRLPTSAGPMDRRAFHFPDAARIGLIVGMRLETECSPDFLAILEDTTQQHPDLHFVFVGPLMKPSTWLKTYPSLRAKSALLEYQSDVLSITQACDVFVNPFRQGGGTSAVYAISAGLPVISLAEGDVAEIFGPEQCAKTTGDFSALLDKTLIDGETFKRLSDQAKQRWAIKSDMSAMTRNISDLLTGEDNPTYRVNPNEFVLTTKRVS